MKVSITWTQQTAAIILNANRPNVPKGFDPETGTTLFRNVENVEFCERWVFITLEDTGEEYGYPLVNISRIKRFY